MRTSSASAAIARPMDGRGPPRGRTWPGTVGSLGRGGSSGRPGCRPRTSPGRQRTGAGGPCGGPSAPGSPSRSRYREPGAGAGRPRRRGVPRGGDHAVPVPGTGSWYLCRGRGPELAQVAGATYCSTSRRHPAAGSRRVRRAASVVQKLLRTNSSSGGGQTTRGEGLALMCSPPRAAHFYPVD